MMSAYMDPKTNVTWCIFSFVLCKQMLVRQAMLEVDTSLAGKTDRGYVCMYVCIFYCGHAP